MGLPFVPLRLFVGMGTLYYHLFNLMATSMLLPTLLLLPLGGAGLVMALPSHMGRAQKVVGFLASCLTFLTSLLVWRSFNASLTHYQLVSTVPYLDQYGINVSLGIDGLSIYLVLLTTLLVPLCILLGWSYQVWAKEYVVLFLVLESLTLGVFLALDLVVFYVCFEAVLIPMYFIIGVYGSRARKVRAAYQFFLYTLAGSLLMLMALFLITVEAGTTDFRTLQGLEMAWDRQLLVWLAFAFAFGIKVPMIPAHLWLPEAHVEAPTGGSVFLAGIMLKLGGYGFLRCSLPLLPAASVYFAPLMATLSVGAIIYTSLTTLRQVDLKKIIAYSSVAHMGVVTLGIFTFTATGIEGSIFLMLGHGFISSALFVLIGCAYDRFKTRMVPYYGALVTTMPLFSASFVFFSMANIGLPGTMSFVGEFLVLTGAFLAGTYLGLLGAVGMVLGGAYQLWVCNRIIFGLPKAKAQGMPVLEAHLGMKPAASSAAALPGISRPDSVFMDLNRREWAVLLPLIVGTLVFGIFPGPILEGIHAYTAGLMGALHA